jgi:hypothetical protein
MTFLCKFDFVDNALMQANNTSVSFAFNPDKNNGSKI